MDMDSLTDEHRRNLQPGRGVGSKIMEYLGNVPDFEAGWEEYDAMCVLDFAETREEWEVNFSKAKKMVVLAQACVDQAGDAIESLSPTTKKENQHKPDFTVPTAQRLKECMGCYPNAREILSKESEIPIEVLDGILDRWEPFTPGVAEGLAIAFHPPAHFWANMDIDFQNDVDRCLSISKY